MTVTPNRANTWASSRPTAPPPSTTSDLGSTSVFYGIAISPVRHLVRALYRRDRGRRAGGDDHRARSPVACAVDGNFARTGEAASAPHEAATLLFEAVNRHLVVPGIGRFRADAPGNGTPIGSHRRRSGESGDAARLGKQVGCRDHHLGGHAAPVGTLTADQLLLDSHNVKPGLGELTGNIFASGPMPGTTASARSVMLLVLPSAYRGRQPGRVGLPPFE